MARAGLEGGQYQPLTQAQIEDIHAASLKVLAETGVHVENERALALYRAGGAQVDGSRVLISAAMVEAALASTPARVLLAGRDPQQDVVLEGRRVYAGTGGSPTMVLDPGADTLRPATLRDVADMARLADALAHCDFVVVPIHPTDVPEADVPVNRFYACLSNTTKHVMGGVGSVEGARAVIEAAEMVVGGPDALRARPIVSAITSWMVSPLHLDTGVTDILLTWCEQGLPVALSSAPMAGSTSPVTLAGTLVQLNAEQLSGVVLTQLVRPGTPVLAGYIPGVADMRTGGYLGGAIEFGMMQAAAAQMAHFYCVPIYGSGGMTDAKLPDAQAGYEKMATLMLAAMGGCNYIHHAFGMLTNMNAASLEQALIDNEVVGMAARVLRGVEVTEASLAAEAIARVGPGGHYLMDDHTLRFMRSEFFYPAVADRQNRATWEAQGKQDTRARAVAQVARLLERHTAPGLPQAVDEAVRHRFRIHTFDAT
ncbi:MAG: trimethylamine methyltransferase family protein [Anaerolineae bacterium]|nr:trimethylamine methyltransferase family protein [Anaerolineae bacterium]